MAEAELTKVFGALADPVRRALVVRLSAGDAAVNELAEPFPISLQAVSRHLKVLEDAGLIVRGRDAQRRPCHLQTGALQDGLDWIERYRTAAEERFSRLDELLASDDVSRGVPQPDRSGRNTDRRFKPHGKREKS
ncbi:MAG: ArsR/SmtB family transcription factor [Mycobacteriales bacterium]